MSTTIISCSSSNSPTHTHIVYICISDQWSFQTHTHSAHTWTLAYQKAPRHHFQLTSNHHSTFKESLTIYIHTSVSPFTPNKTPPISNTSRFTVRVNYLLRSRRHGWAGLHGAKLGQSAVQKVDLVVKVNGCKTPNGKKKPVTRARENVTRWKTI